ncbi:MAG: SGNH/GDSL hydrolase family protein, partial [Oscillospiraceae bacterium]|nr:SGNH/GDSL hydrolase family protein [Oscillospiraceae bacterium]
MERKSPKKKNFWKNIPQKQKIAIGVIAGAGVVLLALLVFSLCAFGEELPASASLPERQNTQSSLSGGELDADYNKDEFSVDLSKYKGVLLEETKKADDDYLEETLFVGDSNTGRLYGYDQLSLQNTVYYDGIGIQSVPYEPCIYFYGMDEGVSIPKAIALMQPRRIVMNFGTNNADGTTSPEAFVAYYRTALKAIKEASPNTEIIISSIAPMAQQRSYNNISMKVVDSFNQALMEMAKEDGYRFLNAAEELKDEKTGYIKNAYISNDGLHFSEAGCKAYIDYFLRHASDAPDKRTSIPSNVPQRRIAPAQVSSSRDDSSELGMVVVKFTVQTQDEKGNLLSGEQGGYLSSPDGGTTQYITMGEQSKLMVANVSEGYVFAGWYRGKEQVSASKEIYYKVSKEETEPEVILKAVFVKKTALVPVNYVIGEGGVLKSLTTDSATKNTTCTVAAAQGYVFIGWSDGVTTLTRTDAPVASAVTVTAQFKKNAVSSNVSSDVSSSNTSSSESPSSSEAQPVSSDTTPSSEATPASSDTTPTSE